MRYLTNFCLVTFIIIFFSNCATVNSGQYVKIKSGDTLKIISEEFKIPIWAIEDANSKLSFNVGSWYFIPQRRGIMGQKLSRGPASIKSYLSSGNFMWPVPSSKKISSYFGKRWKRHHNGIDIAGREGSYIVASNDGKVVYSGNEYGGFGNIIILAHNHGIYTIYAHNQKNYSKKGDTVHKGQVIAKLGNTGRSTGPHLHFEVRTDGDPVNPLAVLGHKRGGILARN